MASCGLVLIVLLAGIASSASTTCRLRDDKTMEPEYFAYHTCATCYFYLHLSHFKPGKKLWTNNGVVPSLLVAANRTFVSNVHDPDEEIVNSFLNDDGKMKWKQCCDDAVHCCMRMLEESNNPPKPGRCPRTWDGWQCWWDADANSVQKLPCPGHSYIDGVGPGGRTGCPRLAEKRCEADGRWFVNERGREWTNYVPCGETAALRQREWVSIAAHAVSIIAILPALAIFHTFKQLHGHRITLHKNLLISLLLHAIFVITFKTFIAARDLSEVTALIDKNFEWCKVVVIFSKYFRLATYMWMFCEAFYLHRLISEVFVEQNSYCLFYLIGWGVPVLPVVSYGILRWMLQDTDCWVLPVTEYHIEWLLQLPALISLTLNFFFLLNIIRILVTKLKAGNLTLPSQYSKALKATLFLVPLFGVHFFVTLYRPPQECPGFWQTLYTSFDRALDGLQGAVVAILYCYANNEIHVLIQRSMRNAMANFKPMSSSTQITSTILADEECLKLHRPYPQADSSEDITECTEKVTLLCVMQ